MIFILVKVIFKVISHENIKNFSFLIKDKYTIILIKVMIH